MDDSFGYRAYTIGPDGHILWSNTFFAKNDEAALKYARRFVDGVSDNTVEICGKLIAGHFGSFATVSAQIGTCRQVKARG
jgi:hypothetical protein